MKQSEGFVEKFKEHIVWKFQKSIYGLKKASRSWNIQFSEVIQSYGFTQSSNESCVYIRRNKNIIVFVVLYVYDILLIGNNK